MSEGTVSCSPSCRVEVFSGTGVPVYAVLGSSGARGPAHGHESECRSQHQRGSGREGGVAQVKVHRRRANGEDLKDNRAYQTPYGGARELNLESMDQQVGRSGSAASA